MIRSLTFLAFVVVSSAMAGAQVVQVSNHVGSADPWGRYFNTHKKLTFSGRVAGIARTKSTLSSEPQVTVLIDTKNGGISEVELGPKWYVDQQVAKVRLGDTVQVTGSKVMTKDRGIVVASQVVVNGRGGPVLALRRLNGKAYWLPTQVAKKSETTSQDALVTEEGLGDSFTDNVNVLPEPPRLIQFDGGLLNVDTGPVWYGRQNQFIPISRGLNIVNGPYPFFFRPF